MTITHHFESRPLAGIVRAYRAPDAAAAFKAMQPFVGVASVADMGDGACELCGAHGATSVRGWRDLLQTLAAAGFTRFMVKRDGAKEWWDAATGRLLKLSPPNKFATDKAA